MPKTFVKTQILYTYDELEPDAQEKALTKFQEEVYRDGNIPWLDEIGDSFRGLFKACEGITLKDYCLDYDNPVQSWVKFYFNAEDKIGEFYGPRAQAWLENNLLGNLRIKENKKDYLKYNCLYVDKSLRPYSLGKIPPCPFTGYFVDDDLLNDLTKNVNRKWYLQDAFEHLAYVAGKAGEDEIRFYLSEENFKEMCEMNDWMFTEDGKIVYDYGKEKTNE